MIAFEPARGPLVALAAFAGTAGIAAQNSGSPGMVIAHALSADVASGGLAADTPYYTRSAFEPMPPRPWTPQIGGLPDFGALPFIGTGVEIDALSIGLDQVLSSATGVVTVPPPSWGALTLTVGRGTTGASSGVNRIVYDEGRRNGNASDVYLFALPGGVMPPDAAARTFRAQDSTEMGVDAGTNLDAHDVYLAIVYGENPQLIGLLPSPFPTVYFSVSSGTAGVAPGAWWGTSTPSGATVLFTTWDGFAWSPPAPFLLPAALGLTAGDDVDAIAIDLETPRGYDVLFSTTPVAGRSQILFASGAAAGYFTYRLQDGRPVATAGGLLTTDNLDGICALDPSVPPFDRLIGRGKPPIVTTPQEPGCSVFRRWSASGDELVSWMAGWPPAGQVSSHAYALFGWPTAFPAWDHPIGTVSRPTFTRPYHWFDGHPHLLTMRIPSNPNLIGQEVFIYWAAVDWPALQFNLTRPVGIRL